MTGGDADEAAAARAPFVPDPENPGWTVRPVDQAATFVDIFGAIRVRVEAADRVRIRVDTERRHRNILGTVHGGFMLALVDQAFFIAPAHLAIPGALGGVTIECATQFLSPGRIGTPLDATVEILRETGRMIFMRGLIEQDGTKILAFSGTIRKAGESIARPAA